MKKIFVKKVCFLFLFAVVALFVINYSFFIPSKVNAYVLSKIYKEPVNSNFEDDGFYKCVIDSYNKKNESNIGYTENLSESQLKSITELDCNSSYQITSTKGIEKLTSLKILDVRFNNINNIDVSKNILLERLFIINANIEELDVSQNVKLKYLTIDTSRLKSIDVSKNIELVNLSVRGNSINSIDVSNNIKLTNLYVCYNNLSNIDISNNTNLISFDISNNRLSDIDVSNNTNLVDLDVSNNQLSNLDLTKNTRLGSMSGIVKISDNPFENHKFIYKGDSIVVNNNIKILSNLGWDNPTWTSNNPQIATVDQDGNVNTFDSGEVKISGVVSDKYVTTSTINIVSINSDKYVIDEEKNYIYITNEDDQNVILSNINVNFDENIDLYIDLHTNILYVKNNENILKEFKIIMVKSNEYDLNNNYIYLGNKVFNLDYVQCINCNKEITDNKLLIKYNNEIVKELNLINISSDKYIIDEEKGYIYTKNDTEEDSILSNINIVNGTIKKNNNKLLIKYNNEIVKELNLINISSDKYIIDEEEGYIYTKNDTEEDSILSNINVVNGTIEKNNNKLLIKYDNEIVKELNLINITSNVYNLNNHYIYVYNLTDSEIFSKISASNGELSINNNNLYLNYNEIPLEKFNLVRVYINNLVTLDENKVYISNKKTSEILNNFTIINANGIINENNIEIEKDNNVLASFEILSIDFGTLNVCDKNIIISEEKSYEDFIEDIIISDGLAYKVFDESQEVLSGNIEEGYTLKIYNDGNEIDYFNIILTKEEEYIEIDESIIGEGLTLNVEWGTNVNSILSKIDTSGEIVIKNKNDNIITGENIVGTGSIVSIQLNQETINYTIVINGDIDGDGKVGLSDIMKIANYVYKNKNSLSGVFEKAADFDKNGKYNLQDIMKSARVAYGRK